MAVQGSLQAANDRQTHGIPVYACQPVSVVCICNLYVPVQVFETLDHASSYREYMTQVCCCILSILS